MKINLKTCNEEELWKYIATALARNGVDVILVGGAVVSIYSKGVYKSGDLDFVINDFSRKELDRVLEKELKFKKENRFYKHDDCPHLFLEFSSFPASIGKDYNIKPLEFEHEGQLIKIFSPTDCVRDRLANYAFFNAQECLDQAILVADNHEIDLQKVKDWCLSEDILPQYHYFIEGLQNKSKSR